MPKIEGTADAMEAKGEAVDMNAPKPDVNDLDGWGTAGLEDEDASDSEGVDARLGELLVGPKGVVPETLANGETPEKAAKPVV